MNLTANIIVPREEYPASVAQMVEMVGLPRAVELVEEMDDFLKTTPLDKRVTLTVSDAEVFGEKFESYGFVITRRFVKDEVTFVGGGNGEVCNIDEYLNNIREELQLLLEKV